MTINELLDKYGSAYRFEKITGISANTFRNWAKWGFIPIKSQYKVEKLTMGTLKADINHDK